MRSNDYHSQGSEDMAAKLVLSVDMDGSMYIQASLIQYRYSDFHSSFMEMDSVGGARSPEPRETATTAP